MTQPPRKCAVIGIPNISPQFPAGRPPTALGQPAHDLVADRQPRRVWLAVALPAHEPRPPEEASFARYGQGIVVSLHDQGNNGALRPGPQVERSSKAPGRRAAAKMNCRRLGPLPFVARLGAVHHAGAVHHDVPKRPIMLEPCPYRTGST